MKRTEAPKKQPVPFAIGGLREDLLPTTPAGDNTASYINGFPPITMVQKNAGGLPPKGQDMNQILYELSSLSRWASSGAINSFDTAFSTGVAGYPKGAQVLGDDGATIYISTIDDNTSNPNTGGGGWFNQTNGYLKTANNLSEIAAAGQPAQNSAKANLGVDRIEQDSSETRIRSPDGKSYILVNNNSWGAYSSAPNPGTIALGLGFGGTGAKDAAGARNNLGLGNSSTLNVGNGAGTVAAGNDPRIVGALQANNNLSEISSAGASAQASAMSNIGLARLGIGANLITTLPSFDWQLFDFTTGSNYIVNTSNWTNVPSGISYPASTGISITVDYINSSNAVGVTLIPLTGVNSIYTIYRIALSGAKGSRTFTIRQDFTSADTIPLSSGGLGATTAAGGRATLGLGNSAVLDVGNAANTVAAGNDPRITGAAQKSSNLGDLPDTASARANLGLGPAALRFVGTGANQLPDMNAFAASTSQNGWFKLPSGVIYQWGTSSAATPSSPDVLVTFPIPFPNAVLAMGEHDRGSQTSLTLWQFTSVVNTAFYANAVASIQRGNPQVGSVPQSAACLWWALGY